jgi:hypothetical protein
MIGIQAQEPWINAVTANPEVLNTSELKDFRPLGIEMNC